jgi:uncharacterized protein YraI
MSYCDDTNAQGIEAAMRMTTGLALLPGMAFAILLAAIGAVAAAEGATTTAAVNARAGPGSSHRVVAVIPEGSRVLVHGCIESYKWCDTSWRDERGWVYSAYLASADETRPEAVREYGSSLGVPIIGFRTGDYYYDHYRYRGWYRNRGLYNPLESYREEYGSSYWHQNR